MELAIGVSECFEVLAAVRRGDLTARVSAATLEARHDELMAGLAASLNETVAHIEAQQGRIDEYHNESMELAMAISECFEVLREAGTGNLQARVSEATETSSVELVASLGRALNNTLAELARQIETIHQQQVAIHELSTPILEVWDEVLALPVIGVVDTRRSAEIMERLLTGVVNLKARYVIVDLTGVEVVDTRTADHFLKVVRAAELLGARCIVTGIRPAVAQTMVDIGVDLSSITTLRSLRDGLRECIRMMAARRGQARPERGGGRPAEGE